MPPVERVLRASRLFSHLDEKLVAALARSSVSRRYKRGDLLWRADDAAVHFTVIAAGLVKIVRRGPDGTASILGIFGPRESVGDSAVLARGRYPAEAVAASETVEVLLVEAGTVLAAVDSNPALQASIRSALLEHTEALQAKIRIMSAGSVPKRLSTLLLYLAERFGDEGDDAVTFIPVALSRAELAHLVGATVETTIRTMTRWQRSGLVETTETGFRIRDLAKLEALTKE